MPTRVFSFVGGHQGTWRVTDFRCLLGDPLPSVKQLDVIPGAPANVDAGNRWILSGITSNERYVIRDEKQQLLAKQRGLGRPEATCAALIPIRKNTAWWALTQDERRAIFEEQSHHTRIGLKYLPPIARRLRHCRDLDENAPFDFLTWFEFAAEYKPDFDQLLEELRATVEWKYVDREIDMRLVREP